MAYLQLSYAVGDDPPGMLRTVVETDDIRAVRENYAGEAALLAFAEDLRTYPIIQGREPRLRSGYLDRHKTSIVIIDISIRPYDALGQLAAVIELKMEARESRQVAFPQHVQACFLTTYAEVDSFASAIQAIATNPLATARLQGR